MPLEMILLKGVMCRHRRYSQRFLAEGTQLHAFHICERRIFASACACTGSVCAYEYSVSYGPVSYAARYKYCSVCSYSIPMLYAGQLS